MCWRLLDLGRAGPASSFEGLLASASSFLKSSVLLRLASNRCYYWLFALFVGYLVYLEI